MTSQPPPSRYRVVERGRRLEVIDTFSGEAPAPAGRTPMDAGLMVTNRTFDLKAPRTLRLDDAGMATVGRARLIAGLLVAAIVVLGIAVPWLLVVPVIVLLQPKLRAQVRGATTRWLDRYDPGAGGG